jgi:RNA polymerase sigma factor (sigma-70 family)
MTDSPDSTLIEAAVNGDMTAFAELVARYRPGIWGMVHRTLGNSSDGEDAVQEILMRALVYMPKFDRRRPFGPWILRIASNYCIDQLRRRKARKYRLWSDLTVAEEENLLRSMSTEAETEDLPHKDPDRYLEVAQFLLSRLKPRRRMAFVLREIEGHSYETVAAILGVPEVTARVRVCRARNDLEREFRLYLAALGGGKINEKTM